MSRFAFRPRTRTLLLAVIAVIAVVLPAVAFLVGRGISSTEQRVADARPPDPTVLTAEVTAGPLVDAVVAAGLIEQSDTVTLNVELLGSAVVTALPWQVGDTVSPGSVILEISGRPLFVLNGEFPPYRSLGPGASGPDVAQLQQALSLLGHDIVVTGDYDAATAAAVATMYAKAGYQPAGDPQAAEALAAAQDALEAAEQAESAARDLHDAWHKAQLSETERRQAADVARSEVAAAEASTALEVSSAQAAHATEQQKLEGLRSGGATADEISRQELVVNDAAAALGLARAGAITTVAAARKAYEDAEDAIKNPPTGEAEHAVRDTAVAARKRAEQAVTDAKAALGATLPAAEAVYMDSPAATIGRLDLAVGSDLSQTSLQEALVLSSANPSIRLAVPSSYADLVQPGHPVVVEVSDGQRFEAAIGAVDRTERSARIDHDLTPQAVGLTVRATITVAESPPDTLVVPSTALQQGSDGRAFVEVRRGERFEEAAVEVVLEAVGLAAVASDELEPSDVVRVG